MTRAAERQYGAQTEEIQLPGLRVSVRRAGEGEPVLLLHGFPHTKSVWRDVEPVLVSAGFEVISPDLRGLGATEVTPTGYDASDLAADQTHLLDALSLDAAYVVGFDLGAAPAFAMAAGHAERVRSLTVVEAVIGGLPGAEAFLAAGGPWWFGFHQASGGLAEDVVAGHEERYISFFLGIGSRAGVPDDLAREFVDAYSGHDRLRAAFEHYRAMPGNADRNAAWSQTGRLAMPVTAVGASTVRDAAARQLVRVSEDFAEFEVPDAGHIVPVDAPRELADIVVATARRAKATR